jgi:multisubunit Na+/H+ antiporter MnhE subunit
LLTTTLLAALLATRLAGLLVLLTWFLLATLLTAALILTALLTGALVLIAHRNFSRGMIPHRENRPVKSLFRFRSRGD